LSRKNPERTKRKRLSSHSGLIERSHHDLAVLRIAAKAGGMELYTQADQAGRSVHMLAMPSAVPRGEERPVFASDQDPMCKGVFG
jgi:hypothetical protein